MKTKRYIVVPLLAVIFVSCTILTDEGKEKFYSEDIWVSAYLASWNHYVPPQGNWGNLPTHEIDWGAFTHLVYFTFIPQNDGSVISVSSSDNLNEGRITSIVEAAHENKTPILYSVGGWNTRTEFLGAISDANRQDFIQHLIKILNKWNFDGIDINMEPIREEDREAYTTFIDELYTQLQDEEAALVSTPLLTATVSWQPELFGKLNDKFDQINIMTYDMSGVWDGWVAWHNSPLYNGGQTFPGATDQQLPSVNREVHEFLRAGVDRNKLGIGVSFYGYVWEGVSEPMDNWTEDNPPDISPRGGIAYHTLYENYNLEDFVWDDKARVPYVSIDEPETFISFENERSIKHKLNFVRENGLGGAMIWELGGGYRSNAREVERDALLNAIKQELQESGD